jgi:RTX calcium-binding nonapeptide repeat (4 copies)
MHQRAFRMTAAIGGATLLLGAFTLSAGPAQAAQSCAGKTPTIVGTSGSDTLTGTSGNDVISGLGGNDRIRGHGGHDTICGGSGNDVLRGGAGPDYMYGGRGADHMYGGRGADHMYGGRGHDFMKGGPGHDVVRGGGVKHSAARRAPVTPPAPAAPAPVVVPVPVPGPTTNGGIVIPPALQADICAALSQILTPLPTQIQGLPAWVIALLPTQITSQIPADLLQVVTLNCPATPAAATPAG